MSADLPVVFRQAAPNASASRRSKRVLRSDDRDVEDLESFDAEVAVDDPDDLEDADDGRTLQRVAYFAAVIVGLLFVQTFLVELVRVRSDSMSPSYLDGDALVVDKITYRFRDPEVDDVVVTEDPRTGQTIVKRVVAVGGDTVGIDDGRLVRNGQVVFDVEIDNDNMDGYFHGPVVVPDGEVFLLGDNRDTSLDSRAFGAVSVDRVQGRVIGHAWPIGGH